MEVYRARLRAIVKDLVEEREAPPCPWHYGPRYHLGNYLGGKFIDFSLAWTMYHPGLDRIDSYRLYEFRLEEILDLDQIMYDWWNRNPAIDLNIPEELISLSSGERAGELDIDPSAYEWRKWEETVATAEKYISEELYDC